MARQKNTQVPKDFNLLKDIQSNKLYKSNAKNRDKYSRKLLESELPTAPPRNILPGQLCVFEYFEPKTKEELEYYDAQPCTIYFGVVITEKNEKRVLGFNIHYYPPRMAFRVLNRIYEIFKPYYKNSWETPLTKEIPYMQYKMLLDQLQKAKLDFGVRMYIPKLMNKIRPVPIKYWSTAVFTYGYFHKRSRDAIMNYWRNFKTSAK